MNLTKIPSTDDVSTPAVAPFIKPSKIEQVTWTHTASASEWGSTVPPGVSASSELEQVLYTAPSTISYAFPYFPHSNAYSGTNDNLENYMINNTTTNYYYFFKIGNRMIAGGSSSNSQTMYLNTSTASYGDNPGGQIGGIDMYDVMISYDADYTKLLRKSHWIIHPGEDLVLVTGHTSNNRGVRLHFEIHEFT